MTGDWTLLLIASVELTVEPAYFAGALLWPAVGLVVAGWSLRGARAPDTCGRSRLALALTGLAAVLLPIPQLENLTTMEISPLVSVAAILLGWGCLLGGLTLASVGLALRRHRPELRRGKRSAIAVLSICGLFAAAIAANLTVSAFRQHQAIQAQKPLTDLMAPDVAEAPAAADSAKSATADIPADQDPAHVFEDFNFRISTMPKAWLSVPPKRLNANAVFAAIRGNPRVQGYVIPEILAGVELDTEGLRALCEDNLRVATREATFTAAEKTTLAGMDALRFEATAVIHPGRTAHFAYCVASHNGFAYQLITLSPSGSDGVREGLDAFMAHFHRLDPEQIARPYGTAAFGSQTDAGFGWRLDLSREAWSTWPEADEELPDADAAGLIGNQHAFAVISVYHGGLATTDQIRGHVLSVLDFNKTPPPEVATIAHGDQSIPVETIRIAGETDRSGYHYRFRIRYLKDVAYATCAWTAQANQLESVADSVDNNFSLPPADFALRFNAAGDAPRLRSATFLNALGNELDDPKESIPYYRAALTCNPEDSIVITNLLDAFNRSEDFRGGRRILNALDREFVANNPDLLGWRAWFEQKSGDDEAAAVTYRSLFTHPDYLNTEDAAGYCTTLLRLDRQAEIAPFLLDFQERLATAEELDALAELLLDTELAVEAEGFFAAALARFPENVNLAVAQMRGFRDTEKAAELLAAYDRFSDRHAEPNAAALYFRGSAYLQLKQHKEAQSDLEKALELLPDNESIASLLADVNALMGKGNSRLIRNVIEPVAIPPKLRDWLAAPVASHPDDTGHGPLIVHDLTLVQVSPDAPTRSTNLQRVHIRDRAAVDQYSTLTYYLHPQSEQFCLNYVRVYDADNQLIREIDRTEAYVLDESDDVMATDDRTVNVPVHGLAPGVWLETQYTVESRDAYNTVAFTNRFLTHSNPTSKIGLALLSADDHLKTSAYNLPDPITLTNGQAWLLDNPRLFYFEPHQPKLHTFLPYLIYGAGDDTWESLSAKHADRIAPKLAPCAEADAIADALPGDTPEAITRAALHWIHQNLTYKAIEFGVRGTIPNRPLDTLQAKWGDCKDLSVLLRQLLLRRGINSHLTLCNSGDPIFDALPSLDQFDHAILCVELDGKRVFVDPTDQRSDPSDPAPPDFGGKHALLLTSPGSPLTRFPDFTPERSYRIERSIHLTDDQRLNVTETLHVSNFTARGLRNYFDSRTPDDLAAEIAGYVTDEFPTALVPDQAITGMDDLSEDFSIRVNYELTDHCHPVGAATLVRLPAVWERVFLNARPTDRRRAPFEIDNRVQVTAETTIHLPKNRQLAASLQAPIPAPIETNTLSARASLTPANDNRQLHLHFAASETPGIHPADAYSNYLDSIHRSLRLAQPEIILE